MEGKKRLRRKKSVNFKDEPEILQTPPKSARSRIGSPIKPVLKGISEVNLEKTILTPRIEDNVGVEGSKTERFIQPAPLLPPFKQNSQQEMISIPAKKPVKTINIVENFNKSLKEAQK